MVDRGSSSSLLSNSSSSDIEALADVVAFDAVGDLETRLLLAVMFIRFTISSIAAIYPCGIQMNGRISGDFRTLFNRKLRTGLIRHIDVGFLE